MVVAQVCVCGHIKSCHYYSYQAPAMKNRCKECNWEKNHGAIREHYDEPGRVCEGFKQIGGERNGR